MSDGARFPLVVTFLVVAAAAALCARGLQRSRDQEEGGRRECGYAATPYRWWILAAAVAAAAVGATLAPAAWQRTVLLDAAALASFGMVWSDTATRDRWAARLFLQLLVLSIVAVAAGEYALSAGAAVRRGWLVVGLFALGYGLKLALVPFYVWLPAVAAAASPLTTVFIVSVVDIAALGELARLRSDASWVFADFRAAWLAMAGLSMLGGSLLALAQRDVKRMLAFSTIDDMGYLLVGIVAGPGAGLAGVVAGGIAHSLSKMLLFGGVALAEAGLRQPVSLDDTRGLAARFPISSAAFVAGALVAIGMPPTLGFAGRSQLYLAGFALGGPWLLGAMMTATALAVLYYARAIHRVWLGVPDPRPGVEPRAAGVSLVVLIAAVVALGAIPGLLLAFV